MGNQKYKILIVDDDAFLRAILRSYLESFEYEVMELESGEEAVAYFEKHKLNHGVDLTITDQIMPGMDGIIAFQKIHAIDHSLPVIMMTGFSSINLAIRFIQLGGTNFIAKPFAPESGALALAVQEALHYKHVIREQEERHHADKNDTKSVKKLFHKTKKVSKQASVFSIRSPWKVLVIGNAEAIHKATDAVLKDFLFDGQLLELYSVYSSEEAEEWLSNNDDVAVILLDIMIETEYAGFDLVEYVRNHLMNKMVRIILRTGKPGYFPEQKVVFDHEIDGFLTKESLLTHNLTIAVTTALRAYRDLVVIERQGQEITEQKNRAERSEKAVLAFLTNLQHETGTVSHQVLSFMEMALTSAHAGDMPKAISRLEKAFAVGDHLKSYHEDLSLVAHLIAGHVPFVFAEWDIRLSVNNAWRNVFHLANERNITLKIEGKDKLPGKIDRIQIEKAISCLLHNAVKFSPSGSIVQVSLADVADHLEIRVSDRGPGIPKDELEHIFSPFAESSSTNKPTGGRGFGLTIAGYTAKGHGGLLTAENRSCGGAAFILSLPKNIK